PFFDTSNESRVESARKSLEQLLPRWSARSGPAALVARSLRGRMPYICVDEGLEPLARRWKTQLDENAKQLAQFDTVPELFHNSLVGWDALSASEARKRAAVLLEWELQPESTAARFRYLTRLLKKRGVALSNVWLRGEDRLLAIVEGVAFGDQVSLFLAEAKRVDPYPVDAITRMKAALSRPG
ncbi:MAG TPA: SIS domain-containing protein, partial [Thermoplasmata archaeon]|nr:SIS domain-containing protein [Thermoplasmata archaeon]